MKVRLLLLVCCLALSACVPAISEDARLDLKSGESWVVQSTLLLPAEQADTSVLLITQALSQSMSDMQEQGVKVETKSLRRDKDGNLPYQITLSGQGYTNLNQAVFGGSSVVQVVGEGGEQQLKFTLYPDQVAFSQALSRTIILHGGKVIASNGVKVNANTVKWQNPTSVMEATTDLPGAGSWLGIGLAVLLAGLLAFLGAFLYLRARRHKLAHGPGTTCVLCGESLPSSATFCPYCGAQQTNSYKRS